MIPPLMQLPFKLEDIRLISIDGDTVRVVLASGCVEIQYDGRNPFRPNGTSAALKSRVEPGHSMFEDGIYGI